MSAQTEIRDQAAYAGLEVAKVLGQQCVFTSHTGATYTVYCTVGTWSQTANLNQGRTDRYTGSVVIYRQPTFPPAEGIKIGCTITYGGTKYAPDVIQFDNGDINLSSSVTFIIGRFGYDVELGG